MLGEPSHRGDQRGARRDVGHRARMQEGGIRRTLVEGQEGHIRDAGEAVQRPADLTARVDAERSLAHLIGDDGDARGGADETAQFGVIAQEA